MLHIRKLELDNLATHKRTSLTLPPTGLVSIIGSNGSGKSTLMEAVATALWGESLRGELPWRAGEPGEVTVTTDQVNVTRKRSKAGSSKVEWDFWPDPKEVTYETSSKAQAALEALIGSYDVWRRTCVLSSLDSAAFSLARDSDRKRLLEEFLGLGMFDTALDACRKDKREAATAAAKAEADRKEVTLRLSFAQQQLDQARKDQAALLAETDGLDLATLKSEGKRMADLVEAAGKDVAAAQAEVHKLERIKATRIATLQHEEERLRKLTDTCPTCGQNTDHAKAALASELRINKAKQEAATAATDSAIAFTKDELADLQAEHGELSKKLGKLREQFALATSQAKQRALVVEKLKSAEASVAEWEAKAKTQEKDSGKATQDAATLEAVEQVLGLRGVRAQVLDHALGALEQQANAWLSRMPTESGALVLTLAGSTTQKSGNTVDAIALKVGGRSYASCSGGERRRVDVALLLALRELAVAAHGRDGTLLCDEVFDALDQQGQADVAAALREMAQDRLVVVVTHSPELVTAMRPDVRVQVRLEDGAAKVSVQK